MRTVTLTDTDSVGNVTFVVSEAENELENGTHTVSGISVDSVENFLASVTAYLRAYSAGHVAVERAVPHEDVQAIINEPQEIPEDEEEEPQSAQRKLPSQDVKGG